MDNQELAFANLIVSMRVYDALMAILTTVNPQQAKMVLEAHTSGKIIGPQVIYDGTHLAEDDESTGDSQS